MPLKSREARRLSVAGLATAAMLAVTASPAAAVQSTTLTYKCKYPLIGVKALSIKIDLDIPNTWPAGEPTAPFGVLATASAFDMAAGLESVDGLTSIQGTSTAFATVKTAQGFSVPAKTVATIAKSVLPKPVPNPLVLTATGSTPPLTFDEPGTETIVLDRLAINLTALDASDEPIPLPPVTKDIDGNKVGDSDGDPNTFDVYCKLDAGQDTTLGKFDIVDGGSTPAPTPTTGATPTPTPAGPTATPKPTATPVVSTPTPKPTTGATPTPKPTTGPVLARLSYTVQGTTQINTLTKGPVPITGALDAQLNTATGDYTAALQLNPTTGRLTVIGFLPVTVGITIVPSGQVTGKLEDDQLTANLRFRTKLTTVKLFGAIPIAGGNECQTKQLSDLALTSTDSFDPTGTGGTIAGSYALSDLNGCGPFNGIVSPFTQGSGNAISLKVTPKL